MRSPRQVLRGFVKDGLAYLLEGELPDGTFVKIIRKQPQTNQPFKDWSAHQLKAGSGQSTRKVTKEWLRERCLLLSAVAPDIHN